MEKNISSEGSGGSDLQNHAFSTLRADQLRSVLDNCRDVIYRMNILTGRYEYISPSAETIVGYSPAELKALNSETSLTMIHPDDISAMLAALARLEETGQAEVEYRQRAKSGDYRWIADHMTLTRDSAGRPLYRDGNIRDMTELKRAEEALQRERDLLQAVMNGAKNSHLVYLDRDFNFVRVNETYAQACGYRPEQMIGKNHFVLYPHAENEAIFTRVRDTGEPVSYHDKPFEFPDQPERGVTYWDWTLIPIKDLNGRVNGLVFSLVETTERKRTEESLRERERRERERVKELAAILDAVPIPVIIVHDTDSAHMTGNRAADELLQHPRGAEVSLSAPLESKPRHFRAMKDGRELALDELPAQRAARGEDVQAFEFELVFDDGTSRYLLGYGTPLLDEQGLPRGAVHVLVDITDLKQAEKRLFEATQRLQALMQSVPVGVSFSDDATCQRVSGNPTVIEQFEVRLEDNLSASAPDDRAPGRQVRFFRDGHQISDAELPLQRAVAENRVIPPMELEVELPDGKRWFVEASGAPVRDAEGNVIAGLAVTLDITERKRAEQYLLDSEHRLKLVLEASSMGTFEFDLLTKEGRWNDTEFELLGLKPGEAPPGPETFFLYVHPEDVGMLRAQWNDALMDGTLDAEFRIVRTDGEVRWLAGKGKFIYDEKIGTITSEARGQALHFHGVNFDITERKRAEEDINKLNEELKRNIEELADANREMEAFVYSVSHDLRAPLRTMANFTGFLFEDYSERLDGQAKEYLTHISKSAKKMSRLIEDLLDLSRLSRKEPSRTEVDLSSLAVSIVSGLRGTDPGRSVEILIKEGITASADQSLMEIVLANLIGNAWKFTSRTARAQIEFGTIGKDGKAIYYVRDNGAGFDPQFAAKMFQPFHRLHPGDEYEGTGIGLSIVEQIIRRHGGKVWAEGEVGKGATVYFTLR